MFMKNLYAKKKYSKSLNLEYLILNVLNRPSKQISLHLLHSICVPKLKYACGVRSHIHSACNIQGDQSQLAKSIKLLLLNALFH